MWTISEREIRRQAPHHVLTVYWRQRRAERALARRGIHFRDTDPHQVESAYAAMNAAEFDDINGRQDWANWRTIPRAMNGQVPDRPLRVLDLGCGAGSSTRVLAYYCPDGSHITGYELARPLLEIARRRTYVSRSGQPVKVDFVCQGITEPLHDADNRLIASGSVDLVNACGVVGHHLNAEAMDRLAQEVQRILKPDGAVLLDVGPTMPAATLKEIIAHYGFHAKGHCKSWWGDPTGQVVFQRGRG